MRRSRTITAVVVLVLVLASSTFAQAPGPPDEPVTDGRTPPRLGYVDGQVSFWRPGAPEWVAAQVNTALAPGDELSTGSPGNVELQVGARAFVRAWAATSLGLVNQDADFLQIKVPAGYVSLDLRTLEPGRVVEVDTPNAAFTIDHAGYYRVDVSATRTSFISRRGGRATVTPASGPAASIAPSEEVVIDGSEGPQIVTYAAPQLDDWDRWNYARTDYLVDAVSARYASPDMYGVSDLDRYGQWRVVSEYGSVWMPTTVPTGWAPYSTGSWTWDPDYGWTWVDTAPWGWAPFHYGRWVFVDGFWGWAPGPVVVRPAYAPALVAFFSTGPGVAVRGGQPVVGWVALGWGEPVVRWWGAPRFVGVPWWGGWGGPRVVNNLVINRTTVVDVHQITAYRNAGVRNAVIAVDQPRFGRGPIASNRVTQVDTRGFEPVRGQLGVKPSGASLAPTSVRGVRPPDERRARPVVATRAPQPAAVTSVEPVQKGPATSRSNAAGSPTAVAPPTALAPSPRLVPAPREADPALVSPRPPFGQSRSERPQPPPPPRFKGADPQPASSPARPDPRAATPVPPRGMPAPLATPAPPAAVVKPQPRQPAVSERGIAGSGEPRPTPSPAPPVVRQTPMPAPQVSAPRVEAPRVPARPLPGEPASRLSPGRGDVRPSIPAPPRGVNAPPAGVPPK